MGDQVSHDQDPGDVTVSQTFDCVSIQQQNQNRDQTFQVHNWIGGLKVIVLMTPNVSKTTAKFPWMNVL